MTTDTKQAKNTWIMNESGQKTFWARANAAGLDNTNAHELFGVESMYEYPGSLADAIKTIENWQATQRPPLESQPPPPAPEPAADPEQAAEQARALAEAVQALPESPVIVWTNFKSPMGFVWCFTLRAGLTPDLMLEAMKQLREQVQLFEAAAQGYNWEPLNGGSRTSAKPPAQPPAPPQTGATPPPVAGAPVPQQGGGNGDLTFDAEKLVATVSSGNVYWKVQGGRFSVHGVTIWPEVLTDAGIDASQLDAMQTYPLTGYVAHYTLNENGNPKKVTALVKAG